PTWDTGKAVAPSRSARHRKFFLCQSIPSSPRGSSTRMPMQSAPSTSDRPMRDVLLRNIQDRKATVGIIGLGYVGLPLAVEFAKGGFKVIGYDISERVVRGLMEG